MQRLPLDYIRGLVEGEGCFTFYTTSGLQKTLDGRTIKLKRPVFVIAMHERDEELLRALRNTFGVSDSILKYKPWTKDGIKRGGSAKLVIRDTAELRNLIIPFFYNKLYGYKGKQFFQWLEKMNDEDMIKESKYLYRLYKNGYFEKLDKSM